ncbi:uncharacterized protein LOC100181467 [Ciona intestinalis]
MASIWQGELEIEFKERCDLAINIQGKINWRGKELVIKTESLKVLSKVALKYVTLKGGVSVALCHCLKELYPRVAVQSFERNDKYSVSVAVSSETPNEVEFVKEVQNSQARTGIQDLLQTLIPQFGTDFLAYKSLALKSVKLHLNVRDRNSSSTTDTKETVKDSGVGKSSDRVKVDSSTPVKQAKPKDKDITEYNANDLKTGDDKEYYLGKGTYGVVRKCHHPELEVVAVKCLNVPNDSTKLPVEAKVLLEAHNEFVVKFYGVCKWQSSLGLIMDYVKGGSLDLLLFDHSVSHISWPLKVRIVHQIACGLTSMHEKDIVHGDLKSSNILLDSNMVPKLADFGAAVVASFAGSRSTEDDDDQFTIAYSAPEVLSEGFVPKRPKADVYSFSIVVFEIAARTNAFEPRVLTNIELFRDAIKSGNRPDIDLIKDEQECETPSDESTADILIQIIEECWEGKPEDRPDMKDICRRIHEHQIAEQHDDKSIQDHIQEIKEKQERTSEEGELSDSPLIPLSSLIPPLYNYSSANSSQSSKESSKESTKGEDKETANVNTPVEKAPPFERRTESPPLTEFEDTETVFSGISLEEMIKTMGAEEDAEELFRDKRYKDAIPLLQGSLRQIADVHKTCMIRLKLAICYYEVLERDKADGELKQALSDIQKPIESSSEIRDIGNQAVEIADTFVKHTRLSRALLIYKSAASVFCQSKDSNVSSHGVGKCIRRLQEHFCDVGMAKHSVEVMQFLLGKLNQLGAVSFEVMTRGYHDAGYFYDGVSEYTMAVECYEKAIGVMETTHGEQAQYQNIYAQCFHNMGVTYKNMNKLKHALDCFTRSLALYKSALDWGDEERKKKTIDKNIRSVENLRMRLLVD